MGPRKELWDLLQSVENYCPEVQDIIASVRDLPTVRTHIGRARAWLRIALMQKKLADYLQALIEHRDDALYEYYEPHALMMSDEVFIIWHCFCFSLMVYFFVIMFLFKMLDYHCNGNSSRS